jgi:hypothetical protein
MSIRELSTKALRVRLVSLLERASVAIEQLASLSDRVLAKHRGVAQVACATGVIDLLEGVLSGVGEDQQRPP